MMALRRLDVTLGEKPLQGALLKHRRTPNRSPSTTAGPTLFAAIDLIADMTCRSPPPRILRAALQRRTAASQSELHGVFA